MELICESSIYNHYLEETSEVDFHHLAIREKADQLFMLSSNQLDFVRRSFEFVRDNIAHSWDIQSSRITCKASEVLYFQEGICYAKSNLLSALLRSKGIPTGFCYQRLTLGDTPDTGYCIHALNASYLESVGRWVRFDVRGNKEGIDSQFSIEKEQLAFPIREEYDEMDYPTIYVHPHIKTITALNENTDCLQMYLNYLPSAL